MKCPLSTLTAILAMALQACVAVWGGGGFAGQAESGRQLLCIAVPCDSHSDAGAHAEPEGDGCCHHASHAEGSASLRVNVVAAAHRCCCCVDIPLSSTPGALGQRAIARSAPEVPTPPSVALVDPTWSAERAAFEAAIPNRHPPDADRRIACGIRSTRLLV